jgi:glycosyltransferase involved in cell wall biosynthesis
MRRRVICVMGRVLDQDDGLGVYSEDLLTELARLDPGSWYVILLPSERKAHLFDRFDNVLVEVLPAKVKIWWDQGVVPFVARRVRADILFNPKFSVPLLSGRPSVFVLQGSDWYANPQNYPWWDKLYNRLMLPIYFRKATRTLAISQCVIDDLVRYAHINASKATVSYAAPSAHFVPNHDEHALKAFAKRYRLPKRFMLSVARAYHTGYGRLPVYPGGNIEGLIQGYRTYRAGGGDLPLVIVGHRIFNYLHARGFGEEELRDIVFTGFILHAEINLIYSLAEFFVLTTLYESFALPLVEAMNMGCPVIVSQTGACPEVAGGAAYLVDPLDPKAIGAAMRHLESSAFERDRLRRAGLQRARTFSWTNTARLTLSTFDAIVPRPREEMAVSLDDKDARAPDEP